jgi:CHASE3 domain sensor protein
VLRRNSWVLAGLAVFGAVCALVMLLQLHRLQRADKQVRAANEGLRAAIGQLNLSLNEANRVKDEYISYYLSTHSQYLDKLEALKHSLQRC